MTTELLQEFWDHLERASGTEGCWYWCGRTLNGYGRIEIDGRFLWTHRFAYWQMKGPIPHGQVVMHSCDNRLCCNPAHLHLGTVAQNNADRDNKERHSSKINRGNAREIRNRIDTGEDRGVVAQEFGISRDMVNKIVRGTRWAR